MNDIIVQYINQSPFDQLKKYKKIIKSWRIKVKDNRLKVEIQSLPSANFITKCIQALLMGAADIYITVEYSLNIL